MTSLEFFPFEKRWELEMTSGGEVLKNHSPSKNQMNHSSKHFGVFHQPQYDSQSAKFKNPFNQRFRQYSGSDTS